MPKPHVLTFEKYTERLIKCLPMDDTSFVAKLSDNELLLEDMNYQLKALPTQATKASYFLDHVIKPALDIDDTSVFEKLLSAMEHSGDAHVEWLSCEIKSEIERVDGIESHKALNEKTGMLTYNACARSLN